jgi:Secreted repeat of unknown function
LLFTANVTLPGLAIDFLAAGGVDGGEAAPALAEIGALPRQPAGRPVALARVGRSSQGTNRRLSANALGKKSSCFGECAVDWRPLPASGTPTAGSGARASMVGTTKRADEKPQVTYNDHPLYRFQGDKKPGDTNGQGINAFGGLWWVVSPSRTQIIGSGSTSGGGNGYSP